MNLHRSLTLFFLAAAVQFLAGCAGTPPYSYHFVPGKTATVENGYAIAPTTAPPSVRAAIDAGNRIVGLPYAYGGGHGADSDTARGYDCSGSASYVLRATGHLRGSMPSEGFRHFGQSGEGRWISIYARKGHVFLVIAGLRFDTGWTRGDRGPQWTTSSRPADHCVIRHPAGL